MLMQMIFTSLPIRTLPTDAIGNYGKIGTNAPKRFSVFLRKCFICDINHKTEIDQRVHFLHNRVIQASQPAVFLLVSVV
ncbi:hypothetical protein KUTeg_010690 [Tegillarca granosa]|uniref:Uncharacterized protein n=1 Tax=Tegillarca granosa TaxID=220873 RepID=A0ABQ9F522_TEGGR|nr:hypothetical protein KUTeg_010690 [Tegillarca granosa]